MALFQIPGVFQVENQIQGLFKICANPDKIIVFLDCQETLKKVLLSS